eukprot:TRINITY_DN55428_c0_g1_i1.p1 TRINITY_DN55428_c0_g1~~TRINITY_DN55428_c0_g1_i1.p1  ORF type:complete len:897 (+),score=278.20 TRINITY_DN55428_c0_g1_i1:81-2771(+)
MGCGNCFGQGAKGGGADAASDGAQPAPEPAAALPCVAPAAARPQRGGGGAADPQQGGPSAAECEHIPGEAADAEHGRARAVLVPFLAEPQRLTREAVPRLCALAESSFVRGLVSRLEALNTTQSAGIPVPQDACEVLAGSPDVCERLGFASEQAARICRNLGRCVDSLLYPVLEKGIDLKRKECEEAGTTPEISTFGRACREAAQEDAARLTESAPQQRRGSSWQVLSLLCICVRSALLTLAWLSGAVPKDCVNPSSSPVPPSAFYLSSVNHVVGVIDGTIVRPHIGTESPEETVQGIRALVPILSCFGVLLSTSQPMIDDDDALSWMRYLPFFAFDAATKGLLLYVSATVIGCKRLSATALCRQTPLDGLMRAARAAGVFNGHGEGGAGGGCLARLTPQFAGESGEGHGPRKELFDLLGHELQSEWGPEVASDTFGATASLQEGSAHVLVSFPADRLPPAGLGPGCQLLFRSLADAFDHEYIRIDDTLELVCHQVDAEGDGALRLRCDKISPVTVDGRTFGLRPPAVPCFRADRASHAVWLNTAIPELAEGRSGSERERWLDRYAFVGWLLTAAIANGVAIPLGLPPVFFAMLKDWPQYQPREHHLASLGGGEGGQLRRIRSMSGSDYAELLRLHQLPAATSREEYVRQLAAEILDTQIRPQVDAIAASFDASFLRTALPFRHCSPDELRSIVCGRRDDGLGDFNLRCEFRVAVDSEFRRFPHNEVLLDVLWDVIDSGIEEAPPTEASSSSLGRPLHQQHTGRPTMKRRFLKFLTGRLRLPALPQHETIRLLFGGCPMTPHEHAGQLERLPVAHTCDNSLELPNYAEGLLFRPGGEWCTAAGKEPGYIITTEDRESAWQQLPADAPARLRKQMAALIRQKLITAICSTDRYDLDD